MKKIGIGSDHAGFALKEQIKEVFHEYDFVDYGCESEEPFDYPDAAKPLCRDLVKEELEFGVLICGTGNGMAMTANKNPNIRAALCWHPVIAEYARLHNNANVLVLPARHIDKYDAFSIVSRFFEAKFEGGRHLKRVQKMIDE